MPITHLAHAIFCSQHVFSHTALIKSKHLSTHEQQRLANKQLFKMSWQNGLIKTILDPKNILISSNEAVVIADKYPKARHHYLVLPKEDIASIFQVIRIVSTLEIVVIWFHLHQLQLSKEHLPLLEELHLLARNIIEVRGERWESFQIGFHAQPSMQRLHLHVISKDFISSYLKTKKHWNSFNTSLFVPYQSKLIASKAATSSSYIFLVFKALYDKLETEGCIQRWPKNILNDLLAAQLKCNQCEFTAKTMPSLKEHLEQH